MSDKKYPKTSISTVICIIIIILLVAVLLGVFYYYNTLNHNTKIVNNKSTNNQTQISIKLDDNKELIYDANYSYKDLEGKSFRPKAYDEKEYSLKDIKVPYININSNDATKANAEILQLFNNIAEEFEKELQGDKTWFTLVSYKTFTNDNILSILITTDSLGTASDVYDYYTYNFDLNTLKLMTYEEIYNKVGFASDNIESKAKDAITNSSRLTESAEVTSNKQHLKDINKSIQNYTNSINDNSIKYFIDQDGNLNIIVKIVVEDLGKGEFNTILTIK